jgi:hypothetical protein
MYESGYQTSDLKNTVGKKRKTETEIKKIPGIGKSD